MEELLNKIISKTLKVFIDTNKIVHSLEIHIYHLWNSSYVNSSEDSVFEFKVFFFIFIQ